MQNPTPPLQKGASDSSLYPRFFSYSFYQNSDTGELKLPKQNLTVHPL